MISYCYGDCIHLLADYESPLSEALPANFAALEAI
jgi:hypothetical protein